jgi:hypothetical protein
MILLNAVALRMRMMIWRKAVEFRQCHKLHKLLELFC